MAPPDSGPQPAGPLGQRARALVPAEVLQDRVLARLLPDPRVNLVPVAELVDQLGVEGLGGEERAAVDQLPDLGGADPAAFLDRVGELAGDRRREALDGLT